LRGCGTEASLYHAVFGPRIETRQNLAEHFYRHFRPLHEIRAVYCLPERDRTPLACAAADEAV